MVMAETQYRQCTVNLESPKGHEIRQDAAACVSLSSINLSKSKTTNRPVPLGTVLVDRQSGNPEWFRTTTEVAEIVGETFVVNPGTTRIRRRRVSARSGGIGQGLRAVKRLFLKCVRWGCSIGPGKIWSCLPACSVAGQFEALGGLAHGVRLAPRGPRATWLRSGAGYRNPSQMLSEPTLSRRIDRIPTGSSCCDTVKAADPDLRNVRKFEGDVIKLVYSPQTKRKSPLISLVWSTFSRVTDSVADKVITVLTPTWAMSCAATIAV